MSIKAFLFNNGRPCVMSSCHLSMWLIVLLRNIVCRVLLLAVLQRCTSRWQQSFRIFRQEGAFHLSVAGGGALEMQVVLIGGGNCWGMQRGSRSRPCCWCQDPPHLHHHLHHRLQRRSVSPCCYGPVFTQWTSIIITSVGPKSVSVS